MERCPWKTTVEASCASSECLCRYVQFTFMIMGRVRRNGSNFEFADSVSLGGNNNTVECRRLNRVVLGRRVPGYA